MQTENNNFAMLSLHAEQTQIWAETLLHEVKYQNVKFKVPTFKSDLIALANLTKRFNASVKSKLDNIDLHNDNASNISKVCELLANTDIENGVKFLSAINYLVKNASVVFDDTKVDNDLMQKLKLISEINDKAINFDIKELVKLHKKIVNTPTK
jgi:hypothetical protein